MGILKAKKKRIYIDKNNNAESIKKFENMVKFVA